MAKSSQTQKASQPTIEVRPFGIKDKLGYMAGDFANDMFFIFASSFLLIFYTNVLGIDAAAVGTLFLVARFFDAFTDVGMGRIVDSSKPGPKGRYRPWIRRMALPVVLAGLLMFIPWVANLDYTLRLVYIYVTYIFWGSFMYTSINIPYGSMASAMTDKPVERTALSTFRSVGAAIAGVIIGSILPLIVYYTDAAGNQILDGTRIFICAIVFAVLAFFLYQVCYQNCEERIIIENSGKDIKKVSAGELAKSLITSRPLLALICASIVALLVQLSMGSLSTYLYIEYFRNTQVMAVAGFATTGITLILAPFAGTITQKFGKKEAASIGVFFSAIVFGIMFVIRITNVWFYVLMYTLGMFGSGLFQLMSWAFIADVIDYQTVQTGSNDGGTVYGLYSFARKVGQALAGGLGGYILSAIGYVSAVAGQTVTQAPETIQALYTYITIIPTIGYLIIGLIMFFWYPLGKKQLAEIAQKIAQMEDPVKVE